MGGREGTTPRTARRAEKGSTFLITVAAAAETELQELLDWYADRSLGLADAFVAEILNLYQRLELFPRSGHPGAGGTRHAFMPTFPYTVVYRLLPDDTVRVVAIAHTSRDSAYWLERE